MSDSVENAVAWTEINGKLDSVGQTIDTVKEKQEEMAEDIAKIKEAVYNPDSGLYARLRELENWKKTSSRILWMIITSVVSLVAAVVFKSI
jgi:peptidoglycan hydrolase CwlO-like protein